MSPLQCHTCAPESNLGNTPLARFCFHPELDCYQVYIRQIFYLHEDPPSHGNKCRATNWMYTYPFPERHHPNENVALRTALEQHRSISSPAFSAWARASSSSSIIRASLWLTCGALGLPPLRPGNCRGTPFWSLGTPQWTMALALVRSSQTPWQVGDGKRWLTQMCKVAGASPGFRIVSGIRNGTHLEIAFGFSLQNLWAISLYIRLNLGRIWKYILEFWFPLCMAGLEPQ